MAQQFDALWVARFLAAGAPAARRRLALARIHVSRACHQLARRRLCLWPAR
jgi:hypothetical protein